MSAARQAQASDKAGAPHGLSLAPFRGLRPQVAADRVADLLCPPYDVIDADTRARLLAKDPDNAVILPEHSPEGYAAAARTLDNWVRDGLYGVDDQPALYVYEMRDTSGAATRGLVGAVELRDASDGVILPHENTMAGPVADRLEVMTATGTDLEPIYLVYDGGGAASRVVRTVDATPALVDARTPDGVTHRLWAVTDEVVHREVAADLAERRALIADGHHRYATYQERQRLRRASDGPGPWDRGLALIVDSTDYGPQVHAIHRVLPGLGLEDALAGLDGSARVREAAGGAGLDEANDEAGFAVVLTDGDRTFVVTDPESRLAGAAQRPDGVSALTDLDVTVVHRGMVERAWGLPDDVSTVGYAHSVDEAITAARKTGGVALLLRPTPVAAVAAVAAAGARMPRKSTLFTPKPASGLVMRRLVDQIGPPG